MEKIKPILTRTGVAVATFMAAIIAGGAAAMAQTTSPLDDVTTQVNSTKDTLSSFVTGTAVPVLFGLLILGVGIALAVKYVRRASHSA